MDSQPKESSEDSSPTNSTDSADGDSQLQVARYHKKESDWDELLAQVGSSPMRRRTRQMLFFVIFTIIIVRVPPSSPLSVFFLSSFFR